MQLKRTLVSAIAAFGLTASVMAPVATAQYAGDDTGNNTATVQVQVTTPGVFDVRFTEANFGLDAVELGAATPNGTAAGELTLYYEDSKPQRPAFDVTITATNFSNGDFPNSGDPNKQLASEDFYVTNTYNVGQGQWDSAPGVTWDVGDIGFFVDNQYVANSGPNMSDGVWTPGGNNLRDGATVGFGYAGVGTIASTADVGVAVDVPNTTVQGTYTSVVTISVVAGTQP